MNTDPTKQTEIIKLTPDQIDLLRRELVESGERIIQSAPQLFVSVDIEADGKAGHGNMLSIGAVSPFGEEFYVEIKPSTPDVFIPSQRQFCIDHGLDPVKLLEVGEEPVVAMKRFADWSEALKQKYGKQLVFTGFAGGWDLAFVDLYFAQTGVPNTYGFAACDLKSIAVNLSGKWDWVSTSKSNLPEIIVPADEFTHNALEDAKYQQSMHFALAALLSRTPSEKE